MTQNTHTTAAGKRLWSYEEITAHTENAIKAHMRHAQRNKHRSTVADMCRAEAFGIYISWFDLTGDCKTGADNERIWGLIDG